MGFATIGMVHVTQYLAIVWKYNRGLARRPGAARYHPETDEPLGEDQVRTIQRFWREQMQIMEQEL
jgi:hypothetical protein